MSNSVKWKNDERWKSFLCFGLRNIKKNPAKGFYTLRTKLQRFSLLNRCENRLPYIKLLNKLLQWGKEVVVCVKDNCYYCSFLSSVRGPKYKHMVWLLIWCCHVITVRWSHNVSAHTWLACKLVAIRLIDMMVAGETHRSSSVIDKSMCIPALSGADPYMFIEQGCIIYIKYTVACMYMYVCTLCSLRSLGLAKCACSDKHTWHIWWDTSKVKLQNMSEWKLWETCRNKSQVQTNMYISKKRCRWFEHWLIDICIV